MIFEKVHQVFDSYPECLVHPVSCTGISHDILSKQIKKSYPDYFREYSRFCIRKRLTAGRANFYALGTLFGTKYIATLTTKNKWQEKISPQIFKQALDEFIHRACNLKVETIAIPKLEDVPQQWIEEQFKKMETNPENTIKKVIFF